MIGPRTSPRESALPRHTLLGFVGVWAFAAALLWLGHPRAEWSGDAAALVARAQWIAAEGPSAWRRSTGAELALVPWVRLGRALASKGASSMRHAAEAGFGAWWIGLASAILWDALRRRGIGGVAGLAWTALGTAGTGLVLVGRLPVASALETVALLACYEGSRRRDTVPGPSQGAELAAGLIAAALALIAPWLAPVAALLVLYRLRGARGTTQLLRVGPLAFVLGALAAGLLGPLPLPGGEGAPLPGDFATALYAFVFSSGKSVLLFCPLVLLAAPALAWLRARRPEEAMLVLAVVAAVVVLAALRPDWHGDPSYGPTRLVPMLPILLLVIAEWVAGASRPSEAHSGGSPRRAALGRRAGALVLGAASVAVQVPGLTIAASDYRRVAQVVKDSTGAAQWFSTVQSHVQFIPQFSPLVGHAWLLGRLLRARPTPVSAAEQPWKLVVAQPARVDAEIAALRLDWWWVAERATKGAGGP